MKTSFYALLFLTPFFVRPAGAGVRSVGPDYARPAADVPPSFADADGAIARWKVGTPADREPRGEWWRAFGSASLNDLETRALGGNQDLRAAAARVDQSRALAGAARSNYWPQVAVNASLTREQASLTTDNVVPHALTNTYRTPVAAAWELDLFGRVRRLNESARADADAAAALFEATRLAVAAEVASTYFLVHGLDHEVGLLQSTLALRQRALSVQNARRNSGTTADVDVARAETELATTEAELAEALRRRALAQDALAVLLGEPASRFALTADTVEGVVPAVPVGLPAELLERRPDIAAAERTVAAANARIGVAKAAFFPAISLTGTAGYASGDVDQLFHASSAVWSIGPTLYLPIFQGGRNRANLERSRAVFDETVAAYRQHILIAFREVQDALTGLKWLDEQDAAQTRALGAAHRAAQLAQVRYDAGYVSYLDVIDAQRTALAIERASVQLRTERLNTTVALIKALGGGWGK